MIPNGKAQTPTLKLSRGIQTENRVTSARQFITGVTCPDCILTINDTAQKVYNTGAFAKEIRLTPGNNSFIIIARLGNRTVEKKVDYFYSLPPKPRPVQTPSIESIKIYPEGELVLIPGDRISFEVRAYPNSIVSAMGVVLHEMPFNGDSSLMGIYRGSYTILPNDSFAYPNIPVKLKTPSGDSVKKNAPTGISILSPYASQVVITQGRLAHLEFGLGNDRLGGAKMGYIDSMIPLEVTGKIGSDYRVKLAPGRSAYIDENLVTLMPAGVSLQPALTGKWVVTGDEQADYVKVALERRLPYQSHQQTNPAMIMVDVFGAVNNTNWIAQFQHVKEITDVDYEQIDESVFRIKIKLKHAQHWGHSIYYEGNQLVIRVRYPPATKSLKGLVIGLDAGHGGRNPGGTGITGAVEKNLTLAISKILQQHLEQEGARVIMSRNKEMYFDNRERILFYRDSLPDLLISVHLNSAADPVNAGGTGVFYRYPGFKKLSASIHQHMLALGLKDYGINSSFNFMLNSPTEYPNVLTELLFLSNPEEEALVLDPSFQQKIAGAIVKGLQDFLKNAFETR